MGGGGGGVRAGSVSWRLRRGGTSCIFPPSHLNNFQSL